MKQLFYWSFGQAIKFQELNPKNEIVCVKTEQDWSKKEYSIEECKKILEEEKNKG